MRTFTNTFAINGDFGISQIRCVKMVADRADRHALHLALMPGLARLAAAITAAKRYAAVAGVTVVEAVEQVCSTPSRLQPCWQPAWRGSLGSRRG